MPGGWAIAELIPITSPAALTSGPPELPGLIAASVWIALMNAGRRAVPGRHRAVHRADDAGGHRALEPEGRTDRDHRVADHHLVRVAERERGQAGPVHLEHGEVVVRGHADELCRGLAAVGEHHGDAAARAHVRGGYVGVGEQVAVGLEHEPGAGALAVRAAHLDEHNARQHLRGDRRDPGELPAVGPCGDGRRQVGLGAVGRPGADHPADRAGRPGRAAPHRPPASRAASGDDAARGPTSRRSRPAGAMGIPPSGSPPSGARRRREHVRGRPSPGGRRAATDEPVSVGVGSRPRRRGRPLGAERARRPHGRSTGPDCGAAPDEASVPVPSSFTSHSRPSAAAIRGPPGPRRPRRTPRQDRRPPRASPTTAAPRRPPRPRRRRTARRASTGCRR